MPILPLKHLLPDTPAYILNQQTVEENAQALNQVKLESDCKVLYAIKALPLASVMQSLKPTVDGFSVSSLYEAQLAHEVLGDNAHIHLTTPGIRSDELTPLMEHCSHISFNSLNQWQRFGHNSNTSVSFGLRVNPKLSFAPDARFDPCRLHSKLGVSIDTLRMEGVPEHVQGLHLHTVFSATDFDPLVQTIAELRKQLGHQLSTLQWINLGGGYLWPKIKDLSPFVQLVNSLRTEFGLEIIIEPGKALVGNAGYLVSSVIDLFSSDGKQMAVLDTSINHNPEVFEYQRQPPILEHRSNGMFSVTLVGSTCLAGDLFGEYRFAEPLKLGDRIVFWGVGAYTLIKANRFNGYPLPDIYAYNNQQLQLLAQDSYQAYRQQWFI